MEGGSDQTAGCKRLNAGGIPDQIFFTGEWERVTPSGRLPSSRDIPAGSKIDWEPVVSRARLITSSKVWWRGQLPTLRRKLSGCRPILSICVPHQHW